MFDTDYTLQLLVVLACLLAIGTAVVYERYVRELKDQRDAAIRHADECQRIFDAAVLEAATRHPSTPSNVRVLRGIR